MKDIKFTKDQFLKLLKAFYIGEWVINAHRVEPNKIVHYEEVEQLLYRHAEELGLKDLIIKEEGEPYFPSGKFEFDDEIRAYIEDYDSETFWHELSTRFTDKLAIEKYGLDELKRMDQIKRFSFLTNLDYNLKVEFENHYLDNLKLETAEDILKQSIVNQEP